MSDSERTTKAREQRDRARSFWNIKVSSEGNPVASSNAEREIITMLAAFAASERFSAIKEAREECARIAAKYKTTVDASVDCSDGRRRQIIEFDGEEIARQIRALGEPPK